MSSTVVNNEQFLKYFLKKNLFYPKSLYLKKNEKLRNTFERYFWTDQYKTQSSTPQHGCSILRRTHRSIPVFNFSGSCQPSKVKIDFEMNK